VIPFEKVSKIFIWNAVNSTGLFQLKRVYRCLDVTGPYSFGVVVRRFEQSLNSSHYSPFMVFITQIVRCKLVFSSSRQLMPVVRPVSLKTLQQAVHSLRCNSTVVGFCFPTFRCPSPNQFCNRFSDPVWDTGNDLQKW
jgi:hypothetical protein